MTTAATPAEPADPALSPDAVLLAARLRVLDLLGQLAVTGARRLLGMMLGVTAHILAQLQGPDLDGPGAAAPEARLGTHVAAGVWRFSRMLRIARWAVMLAARIEANPALCHTLPVPPPVRPRARRAARLAPLPVETPAGYARLLVRLGNLLPLPRNPTRDEARALERALARRGVAAIIAGFCRDLGIEIAPYAALFLPPREDGPPLADVLPEVLSVRDWLARLVARELAKPIPDDGPDDGPDEGTIAGAVPMGGAPAPRFNTS